MPFLRFRVIRGQILPPPHTSYFPEMHRIVDPEAKPKYSAAADTIIPAAGHDRRRREFLGGARLIYQRLFYFFEFFLATFKKF